IIMKHYTISFFVARKLNSRINCGASLPSLYPGSSMPGLRPINPDAGSTTLCECTSDFVGKRSTSEGLEGRTNPCEANCYRVGSDPCPRKLAGAALRAGGKREQAGASQWYVLRGCAASHIPARPHSRLRRSSG